MRSSIHRRQVQLNLFNLEAAFSDFSYVNEKYRALLNDEERENDEPLCDKIETEVFLLKQNTIRWLQENERRSTLSMLSKSSKSSKSSYKKSNASSRSTSSRVSIKEKMLEEELE